MSVEAKDSTVLAAEEDNEVVQESSQPSEEVSEVEAEGMHSESSELPEKSDVEVEDPVNKKVNPEDETEKSGSFHADDTSGEAVPSLKETVAIYVSMQGSQKKSFSGDVCSTESRKSGDKLMGSQEGGSSERENVESQQGSTADGTESQQAIATDGTETHEGAATDGAKSQASGATYGTESQKGVATDVTESQKNIEPDDTESQQVGAPDGTESQHGGEDEAENVGVSEAIKASGQTVIPDESTRSQSSRQNTVDIDANMQDSQKSLPSGGGKVMDSQQGEEIADDGGKELKQGDSISDTNIKVDGERKDTDSLPGGTTDGTESQQVLATGDIKSRKRHVTGSSNLKKGKAPDCTESQKGGETGDKEPQPGGAADGIATRECGATEDAVSKQVKATDNTESQQVGATGGEKSQEGDAIGIEKEAVCSSGRQEPLESNVADVSNAPDLQYSVATGGSNAGESQEEAVCGSSRQEPLENGAVAGASNGSNGGSNSKNSQKTAGAGDSNSKNSEESGESSDDPNTYRYVHMINEWPPDPVLRLPWWSPEGSLEVHNNQCSCNCCLICDYLKRCSKWIQKSEYFKNIRRGLVIMAILVMAMGLANSFHCPVETKLPILVAVLGILGVVLLVSSLITDERRVLCPNVRGCYSRVGMMIFSLLFVSLFGAVLHFTYAITPTFDPLDKENYCSVVFYKFTYYVNFIIGGLVALAIFIYVPTLTDNEIPYQRI